MKFAIPLSGGILAAHFGHCDQFALIDIDDSSKKILHKEQVVPPAHEPGVLPKWLADKGANVIIAGGMGSRAQQLFVERGIRVIIGAPAESPDRIVEDYINGKLVTGRNVCDH